MTYKGLKFSGAGFLHLTHAEGISGDQPDQHISVATSPAVFFVYLLSLSLSAVLSLSERKKKKPSRVILVNL